MHSKELISCCTWHLTYQCQTIIILILAVQVKGRSTRRTRDLSVDCSDSSISGCSFALTLLIAKDNLFVWKDCVQMCKMVPKMVLLLVLLTFIFQITDQHVLNRRAIRTKSKYIIWYYSNTYYGTMGTGRSLSRRVLLTHKNADKSSFKVIVFHILDITYALNITFKPWHIFETFPYLYVKKPSRYVKEVWILAYLLISYSSNTGFT